jgi:Porin PorA
VNRKTMEDAPAPAGSTVSYHKGLVVGFPLTPEPHDYPYWDFPTQTTVVAHFQGIQRFTGRQVYVYSVHAKGPVKDPQILKSVPKTVPLELTSESDATFYVDPATSVVYDVAQSQVTQAKVKLQSFTLPAITVSKLQVHFSQDTANAVNDQAETGRTQLFLLRTGVPGGLAALGGLLAGYPFALQPLARRIRAELRARASPRTK